MEKIIVMLSGGLDSRVVVKLMQEKYEVIALYFKFPFSKDNEAVLREFSKKEEFELKVFDGTKGKLLQEYLDVIKKPIYGRGSGINPCIDCRLFMLKKAKEFADKNNIKYIATGEVFKQRPMSQHRKGLEIVESSFKGRLIRPLIDLGIQGRRRIKQIELANKFGIEYPNSSGGCILCEKGSVNRLKFLLKRGLDKNEVKLIKFGRHFNLNGCWIVLGRDQKENDFIEQLDFGEIVKAEDLNVIGPNALVLDKCDKDKINKLIRAYSKGTNPKEKEKFQEYVL